MRSTGAVGDFEDVTGYVDWRSPRGTRQARSGHGRGHRPPKPTNRRVREMLEMSCFGVWCRHRGWGRLSVWWNRTFFPLVEIPVARGLGQ